MSDAAPPVSKPEPRRRLARDLFLLGLKEALGRGAGATGGEISEPLATLLARSLAGISPANRQAAAGVSHGR
jgi:hypothetical protein